MAALPTYFLVVLASLSFNMATTVTPSDAPACPGEMPAPDAPFRVVWNHPDPCAKSGIHLDLAAWGIVHNRKRGFLGDQVQTLYRTGSWPRYNKGQPSNGGLPQLFNMSNMAATRRDLAQHLIRNFTGLAVLDWETWRAYYYSNFGGMTIYKTKSIELVRKRHPDWTKTQIHQQAYKEWDQAASQLMSKKLDIGKEWMPGGHWGYYLYPRAWGGNSTASVNDKMAWLWRQATGLYPSIYLGSPTQAVKAKIHRVHREVEEAVRIQAKYSPPNTALYPYTNIQQGAVFFDKDHLSVTLGEPADLGASGAVIWGSSSLYRIHNACHNVQQHIKHVLGPFVLNLTRFTQDCSDTLCGGHGRCVHNAKDVLMPEAKAVRMSAQCAARDSPFRDYHCRCYHRWQGACCAEFVPLPCKPETTQPHTHAHTSHSPEMTR